MLHPPGLSKRLLRMYVPAPAPKKQKRAKVVTENGDFFHGVFLAILWKKGHLGPMYVPEKKPKKLNFAKSSPKVEMENRFERPGEGSN